ncbi:MAG: hypothetical protein KAV82_01065, partial [Phycisphaerae bacterium]|nr:hypothetical protein [Phycisphaerae bacterium]
LPCGDEITITANIGGTETAKVLLEGEGTGTVGFDQGSVGLAGERLLLRQVHYDGGDTVVIRITSDRTGTSPDHTGNGDVEVYAANEPLPEPDFGGTYTSETDLLRFRFTNHTNSFAQIHIIPGSPTTQSSSYSEVDGEGSGDVDSDGGFDVRIGPNDSTDGWFACEEAVTITATLSSSDETTVLLTGAGTGTQGFDEGSVGLDGERLLIRNEHFDCGDTVYISITDDGTSTGPNHAGTGEIEIYGPDQTPPEAEVDDDTGILKFRISNETNSFAQMHITLGTTSEQGSTSSADGEEATSSESDGGFDVRVPPNTYTDGWFDCGDAITITASLSSTEDTHVLLEGDGTGTQGFDEGSVGSDGERLLVKNVHFVCGDTVYICLTDDGSSSGPGLAGRGQIDVYEADETPPEPDLESAGGSLQLRIENQTESYTQLHIILGPPAGVVAGIASQDEDSDGGFDVRVAPGDTANGVVSCNTQIILVARIVRPSVDVDEPDYFNYAVLTGAGTGTVNFDQSNVGSVAYQRLLLEGEHYDCGDIISIEFTSDGGLAEAQAAEQPSEEEEGEGEGEGEGEEEEEESSSSESPEAGLGAATVSVT